MVPEVAVRRGATAAAVVRRGATAAAAVRRGVGAAVVVDRAGVAGVEVAEVPAGEVDRVVAAVADRVAAASANVITPHSKGPAPKVQVLCSLLFTWTRKAAFALLTAVRYVCLPQGIAERQSAAAQAFALAHQATERKRQIRK